MDTAYFQGYIEQVDLKSTIILDYCKSAFGKSKIGFNKCKNLFNFANLFHETDVIKWNKFVFSSVNEKNGTFNFGVKVFRRKKINQ